MTVMIHEVPGPWRSQAPSPLPSREAGGGTASSDPVVTSFVLGQPVPALGWGLKATVPDTKIPIPPFWL